MIHKSSVSLTGEGLLTAKSILRNLYHLIKHLASTLKHSASHTLPGSQVGEILDLSLQLNNLFAEDSVTVLEPDEISMHLNGDTIDFRRTPDSPGFTRRRTRAPIHELVLAIDALEDLPELRSLAHFLTQQYNVVGTELHQQLDINAQLRKRLREANNRLGRINLYISQNNQRLAVMEKRLTLEADKNKVVIGKFTNHYSIKAKSCILFNFLTLFK